MTHNDITSCGETNSSSGVPLPRQGWEEHFQRMAENGDDVLLDADVFALTEWDEAEWEWQSLGNGNAES